MWLLALALPCLRSFSFKLTSNSAWEIHFKAPEELGADMAEFCNRVHFSNGADEPSCSGR